MNINKIKQAAEIAKSRTSDKRWIAAIDKAVAGVESGWWVITELANCLAITTETGNTYFANGVCQCRAYENSTACKHRALYRLYQIAQETAPAVSPTDEEIIADVNASDRKTLIAEILACWPAFAPGVALDVELLARFKVNRLDMLADDMLQAIRLAIAL